MKACFETVKRGVKFVFERATGTAENPAEKFVLGQRDKFAPEKRPCQHPFDCDLRDALGLPHIAFTNNDVVKHQRRASRWWHPDHRGDVAPSLAHEAWLDFVRIAAVLRVAKHRKSYVAEVDQERSLAQEEGQDIQWRLFNKRFMKKLHDKERCFFAMGEFRPGSEVRVHGLQNNTELNDMVGTCLKFVEGRWHVRLSPSNEVKALLSTNLKFAEQNFGTSMCHVFLDGSGSMIDHIQKGKQALRDLFSSFILTPTNVHLIGTAGRGPMCSRCLYDHKVDLENKEAELLESWTTAADSTFLWGYMWEQVKDFAELNHEVIIITDGLDNESAGNFRGLTGFNELMTRMGGKRLRISLFLIGSSLPSADSTSYRDLCLATGGVFHHSSDHADDYSLVVQEFVAPLLLTEAERDIYAVHQQKEYQHMLDDGTAMAFEWFLPLLDVRGEGSSGGGGGGGRPEAGQPMQFRPAQRTSVITQNVLVTEIQ